MRWTIRLALTVGLLGGAAGCLVPADVSMTMDRVDPSGAVRDAKDDIVWYDAKQLPIEGKGWTDTEGVYDRLPAKAKGVVTPGVWGLSKDSAGLCVRFASDASQLHVRWTLMSSSLAMTHMPATGVSGLDLYVRGGQRWHWVAVGRPGNTVTNECLLVGGVPPGTHMYQLYLPLYNGVKSLEIGIPSRATLYRPAARAGKSICVYGTSIVQGGCASRPGMAHVAILGRRLDRPTINLGFSGSGKMEPAMAELLAELDVAAYVLDCLPNMTAEMVAERVEPFVLQLRKARPATPIILVENVTPQASAFLPKVRQAVAEKNAVLRRVFDRLAANGVRGLTYVRSGPLYGDDGEATVDGVHATDLGFMRMADALTPVLQRVVAR